MRYPDTTRETVRKPPKFQLGALTAGTVSRYKTGLRFAIYRLYSQQNIHTELPVRPRVAGTTLLLGTSSSRIYV